jgi:hypothetical protein
VFRSILFLIKIPLFTVTNFTRMFHFKVILGLPELDNFITRQFHVEDLSCKLQINTDNIDILTKLSMKYQHFEF